MEKVFAKGDRVVIRPRAYPREVWAGEVMRRAKYGFVVKYELNGMWLKEVFGAAELEKDA